MALFTIAGTVNMSHMMIDVGDLPGEAGYEVVLFGPGDGRAHRAGRADALGTFPTRS